MRVLGPASSATFFVAVLCLSLTSAEAAPRKWTDAGGQFSVDAEFVELKNGEVHLRKADGAVIVVPVVKLSAADRNYLAVRLAEKRAAPAGSSATASPAANAPSAADLNLTKLFEADGGKIARSNWSKFVQAFRTFDADSDDALSSGELSTAGDKELLRKLADANGDGKVVRAEWGGLQRGFAKWDKNQDEALEKSELDAAAETALAKSSGTATLKAETGPIVWRGSIEGRGNIELVVNGNQIVGRDGGGGGLGTGTFTMTGNGKIGNMDAVYVDGPNQGQVCLGIYQLEGDTLTWCVSNRPGQRPQDFSPGRGNWPMVLTRAAP